MTDDPETAALHDALERATTRRAAKPNEPSLDQLRAELVRLHTERDAHWSAADAAIEAARRLTPAIQRLHNAIAERADA